MGKYRANYRHYAQVLNMQKNEILHRDMFGPVLYNFMLQFDNHLKFFHGDFHSSENPLYDLTIRITLKDRF